jgi:hypothetical protein
MLEKTREMSLLQFTARLCDEPQCHILQDDRLQGEGTRTLPALNQTAPQQSVESFQEFP